MATTRDARKSTAATRHIAVIGGGAKAAALAAKAKVLSDLGKADIRITVFEADAIGANWSGASGYTDGQQRLCTIAERDVGYPYSSMFGPDVDAAMASEYSWGRYLISRNKGFSKWVDSGRKPPIHEDFARYLKWVIGRSRAARVMQRVTDLSKNKQGLWQVKSVNGKGSETAYATAFDAVVVTGPGDAKHVPIETKGPVPTHQMFDGKDFWHPSRARDVQACLAAASRDNQLAAAFPIVIVGAGGTAAAILAWLVSNGARDLPIQMVASQPSLYTRVDSVFENRLSSDEEQWATLSEESKKSFFDRQNRGVVWDTVMDRVSAAENFTLVEGRAQKVMVSATGELGVQIRRGDGLTFTATPSMLIDASGFDAWWFLPMVRPMPLKLKASERAKKGWAKKLDNDLSFSSGPWTKLPPLHAPMLSSFQGPGYVSLMVLGAMADRILKPYT